VLDCWCSGRSDRAWVINKENKLKSKTIKSVLRKKFSSWSDSIEDKQVQDAVKSDGIVSGGSIASMLLREEVHDYDIYFKTKDTAHKVACYYVDRFKKNPPVKFKNSSRTASVTVVDEGNIRIVVESVGIASEDGSGGYQYFEQVEGDIDSQEFVDSVTQSAEAATSNKDKGKYRPVFLSSNAITLSDDIQLIFRFYGEVEKIHENFDFVHCTCSWDAESGKLTLPSEALECLLARELRYTKSKYPLCSIIRTRKFLKKGWNINAGQFVKMAWDLNQLDLTDFRTLEDQMIGVDAAYFAEVLALLKEKDSAKVDGTYLMQAIDKIF